MNISLAVEGTVGADPLAVLTEMCALADRLQVAVHSDLNEVLMVVRPGDRPDDRHMEFLARLAAK